MAVNEMRSGDGDLAGRHRSLTPSQEQSQGAARQVIGREGWHQSGGGWIGGAIYGANDGLASVFGIVAGVSGATAGSSFVLTAGAAGAIASALSMATGAFLAERSEAEVAAANSPASAGDRERPEEEKEELSLFYQLKGVDEATADAMAEQLARSPTRCCRRSRSRSSAGHRRRRQPGQAAIAAGISTGLGAMIPVIPFIFCRHDRDPDLRCRLTDRPLPGRRRQVARDAADLVGGRP